MRYFSYSADDGFELHATAAIAASAAERLLELERDAASEGWSESASTICWGEIKQHTVQTVDRPRTDKDVYVPQEFDRIADFCLVDVRDT